MVFIFVLSTGNHFLPLLLIFILLLFLYNFFEISCRSLLFVVILSDSLQCHCDCSVWELGVVHYSLHCRCAFNEESIAEIIRNRFSPLLTQEKPSFVGRLTSAACV